jgi:oxepin-CoA hydrolase / 3-oxo-5,6-dehydrosuberyl-CoA semialdehyde dehydrogenase
MNAPTTEPRRLQSYLAGAWQDGAGDPTPLKDAATGATVALIGAHGLDFAGALAWGRDRGGPRLRAMTVHERALMLKGLGQALMAAKEEFYALSIATGATRSDSWIDIEGGIGTLLSYGSKGRRELPNSRLLLDGPTEPLSRDHTFSGQHILTPLEGIAIHINAFNFPVWGMLEKVAPTLLAGMPALVKPASQTAYLAELVFRRMLGTGLLPEGAVQLVCGSVGDLLDHVTCQDVVSFTGSAATGQKLRNHPAVTRNSTRFTMEADSLNAAILGPDAGPSTPEFDLFVREVAREMTARPGRDAPPSAASWPRGRMSMPSSGRSMRGLRRPRSATRPTRASAWVRWQASPSARRSAPASAISAPRPRSYPGTPGARPSSPATPRPAPSSARCSCSARTRSRRGRCTMSRPSGR